MPMDKRTVTQGLHAMMVTRLFGGRPWLADGEACDALRKKLYKLGLQERVPGDIFTTRSTSLGNELQLDLVMVFIGLWDEWEVAGILEKYGLIDEADLLAGPRQQVRVQEPPGCRVSAASARRWARRGHENRLRRRRR